MREAHLRDAVALCDFFAFLEDTIAAGKQLTEVEVSGFTEVEVSGCGVWTPQEPEMMLEA